MPPVKWYAAEPGSQLSPSINARAVHALNYTTQIPERAGALPQAATRVHTMQYERMGGFAPFLRQYLGECPDVGYLNSPLEREAISRAEMFA